MADKKKRRSKKQAKNIDVTNVRFIVPMPGRSSWHTPNERTVQRHRERLRSKAGDLALEDYQAQLLMQREYLID